MIVTGRFLARVGCIRFLARVAGVGFLARVAVLLVISVLGCSDQGDKGTQPDSNGSELVSFASEVQPILTASCASSGCHSGALPAADLSLGAGQSHAAIVNVPALQHPDLKRILPGEPDSSYLYHRLTAAQGTTVMPPGGALPADQIAKIRTWIEEGAQNN